MASLRSQIYDSIGNQIEVGDCLFYTERPFSNYADSIAYVYLYDGMKFVCTLVGNDMIETKGYKKFGIDRNNDITLESYTRDLGTGKLTDTCENMTLIKGLTKENATVEYAEKHFPLGEQF